MTSWTFHFKVFLVFLLCFSCGYKLVAQSAKDYAYPLFAAAIELDTDRVTYAKHKITVQIDSTWEDGRFTECLVNRYAPNGNLVKSCRYPQSEPGKEVIIQYGYDSKNICNFSMEAIVMKGDTTYVLEKRAISSDTVHGKYVYESRTRFVTGRPDTTASDFEWDYIDTKCKTTWSERYANRHTYYLEQHPGNDSIRGIMYSFHDKDTLDKLIFLTGGNICAIDTIYNYHSPELTSFVVFVNHRSTVSKAWENGKLVEHYVYVDSVSDYRIWKSTVYNLLKNDSVPEIVITMSDSINIVHKNGTNVFEDIDPDTVYYRPIPPPIPPEPTYVDLFPYRKSVSLGNGMRRLEYYNFYTGTIKPLFIIIIDEREVVHNYYYGKITVKRVVQ